MTRILLSAALALSLFSGAALAQQAGGNAEQPRKARSCDDVKNDATAPKALVALCAWVGQYR